MSLYAVVNPATGETVKEYPTISDDDLRDAIGRAAQAMRDWSAQTSVEDRATLVGRVGELHAEQRDRLADIIVREMGKPVEQALGRARLHAPPSTSTTPTTRPSCWPTSRSSCSTATARR